MKVVLRANDSKIYLSDKLVEAMRIKKGRMILLFHEKQSGNYGFMVIHGKKDARIIDGARLKWTNKHGYFITPQSPPSYLICAMYGITEETEMLVEKQILNENELFIWQK